MRFELTTLTLARLCSTPELRPHPLGEGLNKAKGANPQGKKRARWRKSRGVGEAGKNTTLFIVLEIFRGVWGAGPHF